jgi:fumarate hydratase, class II
MRVPADALYAAQTQRAVENFPISGIRFPRHFIAAMGHVKKGAALANVELGQLDRRIGEAIVAAADEVIEGTLGRSVRVDIYQTGSGTSTNMNANEVIASLARRVLDESGGGGSVHPNDHVNMGQSSNDVIPTVMHVSASLAIERDLVPSLERLRDALAAKASRVRRCGQKRSDPPDGCDPRAARARSSAATRPRSTPRSGGSGRRSATSGSWRWAALLSAPAQPTARLPPRGDRTHQPVHRTDLPRGLEPLRGAEREGRLRLRVRRAQRARRGLMKIANDIRWLASGPTSGLAEITLPACSRAARSCRARSTR